MTNKKIKKTDPMKTRTGKVRLGPLNIEQLNKLLDSTSKKKIQAQINREIIRKTV